MKILHVSNFYYNRGGDCTYLFSLEKLLKEKGHRNIVFSMHHPQNYDSEHSGHFVSYINYAEEVKNKSLASGIKVLSRSIYSFEARQKIERLIDEEKPDIAHLQNIRHHITPSILFSLKTHGIPVVWTLHDYQLICPNISFLARGRICERCRKRKYFWPLIIRCKKGSLLASAMAALEHSFQYIAKVYDKVDLFVAPSQFLMNKFIEYGFPREKLICLNYIVNFDAPANNGQKGDYYLYVGRIAEEKGLKTLIHAASRMKGGTLKIVGEGPMKEEIISFMKSRQGDGRIELLGHRSHEDVMELIRNCSFLVLPSEWYENFPYVILEAFASGIPVIGSRIGGIPEQVKDYETGLTFQAGNPDDLRSKIAYMMDNPDLAVKMGQKGRCYVEEQLNAEKHYKKLMEIYEKAIGMARGS